MLNLVPIVVDSEEIILEAIRRRAVKERVSPTMVINHVLRRALRSEIEEAAEESAAESIRQDVMQKD